MGWQDAPIVSSSWQDAPIVDENKPEEVGFRPNRRNGCRAHA